MTMKPILTIDLQPSDQAVFERSWAIEVVAEAALWLTRFGHEVHVAKDPNPDPASDDFVAFTDEGLKIINADVHLQVHSDSDGRDRAMSSFVRPC